MDPPSMSAESEPLTYGEKAVGLTFDPSGDPRVQKLKEMYAEIIDFLNDERDAEAAEGLGGEDRERLFLTAITEAQGAQMWAEKAVTWQD